MKKTGLTSLLIVLYGWGFSQAVPCSTKVITDTTIAAGRPQRCRPLSAPVLLFPAVSIGYGVLALKNHELKELDLSTKNEIREDHPHFATGLDNYLQFSPVAAVAGLNIAGIAGAHGFKDELLIYGLSTIIMFTSVEGLKHITHEQRPDGSSFNSFPSGHTATAFAAAEFLRMEYGSRSPWIAASGYAAASLTGILRLYNNRHWVSDVIAGAGIGFLSTHIAYAVYPWVKKEITPHASRRSMVTVMPFPVFGVDFRGAGVAVLF